MLSKLKKESKGFTIIEVMIVLAIAGLIILIVLLAIPALQRNSRNTTIKNDATAVSAAISEYKSNNDGQLPTGAAAPGGALAITGSGTQADGKVSSNTSVSTTTAPGSSPSVIQVLYGQKCQNSTSFSVTVNLRSAAILYNIETSSGVAPRCTDA